MELAQIIVGVYIELRARKIWVDYLFSFSRFLLAFQNKPSFILAAIFNINEISPKVKSQILLLTFSRLLCILSMTPALIYTATRRKSKSLICIQVV